MVLLHERYEAVDYSTFMYTLENSLVSRKPSPHPSYQSLVKPFSLVLWCLTFLSLLTTTIFFLGYGYFFEGKKICWNSGILAYMVFVGQSKQYIFKASLHHEATKITFLLWLFFCTFLFKMGNKQWHKHYYFRKRVVASSTHHCLHTHHHWHCHLMQWKHHRHHLWLV